MFGESALTFREFAVSEPLPLSTIHQAVLEFLRGRDDVVVFGAQAVNAYVDEPRMTQDVALFSTRAAELVEALRAHLADRFQIALRIRQVSDRRAYRLFQIRKPKNRHLVDVRSVDHLPPTERIAGVLVVTPAELVATKVVAYHRRRGQPKAGTDWRDLAALLLTFPDLKSDRGAVRERLESGGADAAMLATWVELVNADLRPEDEDEGF